MAPRHKNTADAATLVRVADIRTGDVIVGRGTVDAVAVDRDGRDVLTVPSHYAAADGVAVRPVRIDGRPARLPADGHALIAGTHPDRDATDHRDDDGRTLADAVAADAAGPARAVGTAVAAYRTTSADETAAGRRLGRSGSFDHYGRTGTVRIGSLVFDSLRAGDDVAQAATDLFLRMARDAGAIDPDEFDSLVRIGTDSRSWEQVIRIGHGNVDADVSRHAWLADAVDGRTVVADPDEYPRAAAPAVGADRVPNLESVPRWDPRAVAVGDILRDERRTGNAIRRQNRTRVPFPSRYRGDGRTPRGDERRTVVYRDSGTRDGRTRHSLPAYRVTADGRTLVAVGHGPWRDRTPTVADRRRGLAAGTTVHAPADLPGAAAAAVRSLTPGQSRRVFSSDGRRVTLAADKRGRIAWRVNRRGRRAALASGRSSASRAADAVRRALV